MRVDVAKADAAEALPSSPPPEAEEAVEAEAVVQARAAAEAAATEASAAMEAAAAAEGALVATVMTEEVDKAADVALQRAAEARAAEEKAAAAAELKAGAALAVGRLRARHSPRLERPQAVHFAPRRRHACAAVGAELWVFGGEVWLEDDGETCARPGLEPMHPLRGKRPAHALPRRQHQAHALRVPGPRTRSTRPAH